MRRLYPAECQHCHQRDSEVYEFEGEQSGARLEQGNADIFYAHLACVGPLLLEWRNERDGDYYITLGPERITVLGTKEDAIRTAAAGRGYDEELGL
ncbi:MAG TPA: hypothetical protein VJN70_12575 [Gemmatimonadaceae bacterium]|nr:hypothetical protein [Gemmatimonadaceae bacterium]